MNRGIVNVLYIYAYSYDKNMNINLVILIAIHGLFLKISQKNIKNNLFFTQLLVDKLTKKYIFLF